MTKGAHDFENWPCAAYGLISYRYRGAYGFIMIGAKSDTDALREAARSIRHSEAVREKLEVWDGSKYVPV
jgi:hypothetical protein